MIPYTKFGILAVITSVLVFATTVNATQASTAANVSGSKSAMQASNGGGLGPSMNTIHATSPDSLAKQLDQIIKADKSHRARIHCGIDYPPLRITCTYT